MERVLFRSRSKVFSLLSIAFATMFLIEMTAKFENLLFSSFECIYALINFNSENDLSALATVTGIVMKTTSNFYLLSTIYQRLGYLPPSNHRDTGN